MKRATLILSFVIALLFAGIVQADHESGHCIITSSSGNPNDIGSLLNLLQQSRCKKITFDVDHVNPLVGTMRVYSGVTIEGAEGIKLQYSTTYNWPEQGYKGCLVRIRPRDSSTAGVTLTNLAIKNQFGEGICLEKINNKVVQGSRFSNLVIESKTSGINLGTSNNNKVINNTITGYGADDSFGVRMQGSANEVNGGKIENFAWAVYFDGVAAQLNKVLRTNMFKIKNQAIRILSDIMYYPPQDLWQAFATSTQYVLAGMVNASTQSVEIYTVADNTSGKDYTYKLTVDPLNKIAPDAGCRPPFPCLDWNERRFTAVINRSILDVNSVKIALKGFIPIGSGGATTVFSSGSQPNGLSSAHVLAGNISCADVEWFWHSFDRSNTNNAYRGWEIDLDEDGLDNSCSAASCIDSRVAEDLDKDCSVQRTESDPTDRGSRYDADGDNVPDHEVPGQRIDNCIPPPGTIDLNELRRYRNPVDPNTGVQRDSDNNGIGDGCPGEDDADGDGVPDAQDNCPRLVNRDQHDSNGNHIGDACERMTGVAPPNPADADSDGVVNVRDNCPYAVNPDQKNTDDRFGDGDNVGDACDPDIDNDGVANTEEDWANLGVVDVNPVTGLMIETDPFDPDSDDDGICDGPGWGFGAACVRPLDNCPLVNNREQTDRDEDTIGDACDIDPVVYRGGTTDSDGDGAFDETDNCPAYPNPSQKNSDDPLNAAVGNCPVSRGDPCDSDDDNDGLSDAVESGMFNPTYRSSPNAHHYLDSDTDNDGFSDGVDICPIYMNMRENQAYAADPTAMPDSKCGNFPVDDLDNDGVRGSEDNCPFVANKDRRDTDTDGIGDACDPNGDSDGKNDIDESNNCQLFSWDPNSDHKDGEVFQPADTMCDGPEEGFDRDGSLTKCIVDDPCPEFYNPEGVPFDCVPGSNVVPPGPDPSGGVDDDTDNDTIPNALDNCPDISNINQLDTDSDGLGDVCDPNPSVGVTPNVQGSGCSLNLESKWNNISLAMILLNAGLLFLLRRQKNQK